MMKNKDPYNEGVLLTAADTIGSGLLLGFLFLLGCVPVITAGTSVAAFYYAMTKSVRRGRGYPAKEFLNAYRKNLGYGILYTLCTAASGALLYVARRFWIMSERPESFMFTIICDGVILILLGFVLWLFPIISRFEMGFLQGIKRTAVMALRHLPQTLLLVLGSAGLIYLSMGLPVLCIFIVPPAWCYTVTYIIEPVFGLYIIKPNQGVDDWYYDDSRVKKSQGKIRKNK